MNRTAEASVSPKDVLVEVRVNTSDKLIALWNMLLSEYEGYIYCVKGLSNGTLITGGVYDPNDIDILSEHLNAT